MRWTRSVGQGRGRIKRESRRSPQCYKRLIYWKLLSLDRSIFSNIGHLVEHLGRGPVDQGLRVTGTDFNRAPDVEERLRRLFTTPLKLADDDPPIPGRTRR